MDGTLLLRSCSIQQQQNPDTPIAIH
eukprot:COSAG01_NODE_70881_length_257_cov_0.987342_2_plen_25_part_01